MQMKKYIRRPSSPVFRYSTPSIALTVEWLVRYRAAYRDRPDACVEAAGNEGCRGLVKEKE